MSNEASPELNAVTSSDQIETAKWTRYLPEAFGIREAVRQSKYRWCVREAAMWGIATGTAMTLHRYRMQSRRQFAANVGFASLMVVYVGSYYFCVKRRDYREQMIELMMKLNSFEQILNYLFFHPEFGRMVENIFGEKNRPVRKLMRMTYWMSKFKHMSPFPLPFDLPEDNKELALLAIKQITTVDINTEVQVYETKDIDESMDKTWIVSGAILQRSIL